jgi:predicted AlkP superfamily pyrophosphatase or phosphodiesterase
MKTKPFFTLLIFSALIFFFTESCANTKYAGEIKEIPQDFVPAKHLVFIGLDGWGGAYVNDANMPTVKHMMSNGAWTLDVWGVLPVKSWPNWTSLFCGAPPKERNREDFSSIFTLVKNNEQTKKSAFFYEWTEFQKICPNDAVEKQEILSDVKSAEKIASYITEQKPVFTAIVFNEPDAVGHAKRWGSANYYAKLAEMDALIAIIEQAVKDAGIYDNTVFMLSADHGGSGYGHESNSAKRRKTPLIVFGSGIKKGYAITSPVNIYDIAPTMAALLGMNIPPEWTGRIIHEIFK